MKKPRNLDDNLDEYEIFYLEIPRSDYSLEDIEIQDEYDSSNEESKSGDDVADYKRASLDAAKDQHSNTNQKDSIADID